MSNIYAILSHLQVFLQLFLWLLSFYWIDFELFTYIFNENYYIKIISGIAIISCQLFLLEYLFYLVKIDSIYEKENDIELQNINEKHDYTTCKKCNILRPKRAHHCHICDKCILKMDHHCFILNKCIGENNFNLFVRYIIMAEINASLAFWITLYVFFYFYSEIKLIGFIKYGILIFISFMGSCGLFFYIMFQIYLILADLTTLEFIYPNLRQKTKN